MTGFIRAPKPGSVTTIRWSITRRVGFVTGVMIGLLTGLILAVSSADAQDAPTPKPILKFTSADTAHAPAAPGDSAVAPPDSMDKAIERRDVFDVWAAIRNKDRVEPEIQRRLVGVEWSILPSISYNSVYGVALGGSLTGAGWPGSGENARPVVISLSGTYSTEGQLLLQARGDIYSKSGDYLLKPDIRYMDTRRSTWGLGPVVADQSEYPMDFVLTRMYATLLRRAGGSLYVGLGLHYDQYGQIVDTRAAAGESTPFTDYSGGAPSRTQSAAYSVNVLGDTRDNLVNPKSGYFLSALFRNYQTGLGSDDNWQEFLTEMRLYTKFPRAQRNILAFWVYSWLTFGHAPYLDLPASGWDTYGRGGRGYLQGRIRGENQIYFEAEYRMELRRDGLLGGVVFFNSTLTTPPEERLFSRGDLAAGLGLRIKFNKNSDTNLVVDYGWGREGSRGLTLAMSEAF